MARSPPRNVKWESRDSRRPPSTACGLESVDNSAQQDAPCRAPAADQTDPHTPGVFRPYVVRNLNRSYNAVTVLAGTRYYLALADRIKVW